MVQAWYRPSVTYNRSCDTVLQDMLSIKCSTLLCPGPSGTPVFLRIQGHVPFYITLTPLASENALIIQIPFKSTPNPILFPFFYDGAPNSIVSYCETGVHEVDIIMTWTQTMTTMHYSRVYTAVSYSTTHWKIWPFEILKYWPLQKTNNKITL